MIHFYLDNCGNSRANTCPTAPTPGFAVRGKSAFISSKPVGGFGPRALVTLDNFEPIAWPRAGDASFKCLPYQMTTVRDLPTVLTTGSGESGFDSGEGA